MGGQGKGTDRGTGGGERKRRAEGSRKGTEGERKEK